MAVLAVLLGTFAVCASGDPLGLFIVYLIVGAAIYACRRP